MHDETPNEKHADIHAAALQGFNEVQAAQREEREQNIEDRRFVTIAGAQWEGSYGAQFENKPRFEVNKVQLSLDRIKNEYKNNRITANFEPVNGDENDVLSDTCDDLYRATERKSVAKEAYDNAFDEGTAGGIGAWRLRAVYEDEYDEENELKTILIEPQFDADSTIFFDLGAKRQDKLDATRAWALTAMQRSAYEEEFEDDVSSWPMGLETKYFYDENVPDIVYVAEYYQVDEGSKTISKFQGATGDEVIRNNISAEERAELLATGYTLISERKVKEREVHKYLMSGSKMLRDEGVIAGKYIPIVPYFGKRSYINNIERSSGHVRLAKDMQRLKNMQVSWLAEIAAGSGESVPIFTPEQILGHQTSWETANIDNPAYLLINPARDKDGNEQPIGPVGYTKTAEIPQATSALLSITDQDIKDVLGNAEQGEKIVSNISGDAIERIQNRIDMQTYGFMDSFGRAIETSGIIWLSMAMDIYTEEGNEGRKLKGITSQGKPRQIELMRKVIDPETKEVKIENDFSNANMEINVEVGPSSGTKRQATLSALTSMLKYAIAPEDQKVITSMAMMNMEGEGVGEAREYYRKQLVQMGVVQPTDEEAAAMAEAAQNQEPSPQDQFMLSEALKNEATAKKTEADTIQSMAKTENIAADTQVKLEGIERDDAKLVLDQLP